MLTSAIDIEKVLKPELFAGEAIAWTDRPPQNVFRAQHAVQIPIGFALLILTWILLHRTGRAITGRAESDFLVALVLIFLAPHLIFTEPWLDWRRRRQTGYALTNCRAIIVREGYFIASYFLLPQLETELASSGSGTGSIRFGTPARAGWLGYAPGKKATPARAEQLFANLRNAKTVLDRIRQAAHAENQNEVATPFVRRAHPEHQYDADSNAKAHPFEYAQPVRDKLFTGEKTLFIDRPPQGWLFRERDWFYVPFAAVWTTIALGFEVRAFWTCCPAIVGLLFVAVGLYMLVGRFYHDRRERQRTWYAITDRRCLLVEALKVIETKSLYWHFIQGVVRKVHGDGTATLFFELSALGRQDTTPTEDITTMRRPEGIFFERIDNPREVEGLMWERLSQANQVR